MQLTAADLWPCLWPVLSVVERSMLESELTEGRTRPGDESAEAFSFDVVMRMNGAFAHRVLFERAGAHCVVHEVDGPRRWNEYTAMLSDPLRMLMDAGGEIGGIDRIVMHPLAWAALRHSPATMERLRFSDSGQTEASIAGYLGVMLDMAAPRIAVEQSWPHDRVVVSMGDLHRDLFDAVSACVPGAPRPDALDHFWTRDVRIKGKPWLRCELCGDQWRAL